MSAFSYRKTNPLNPQDGIQYLLYKFRPLIKLHTYRREQFDQVIPLAKLGLLSLSEFHMKDVP
jgi:hypothetical protein